MFKIGERVVTLKEIIMAGLLILVALAAVWAMVFAKPKPIISRAPQPAAAGLVLLQGGTPGSGPGQFAYPRGIAVNSKGDLFVADSKNHRIQKFSANKWQFQSEFGGYGNVGGGDAKKLAVTLPGKLNEPNGIAIGADDTIYVADTWNERIQVFNKNGTQKLAFAADDGFWVLGKWGWTPTALFTWRIPGSTGLSNSTRRAKRSAPGAGLTQERRAGSRAKPGEFNEPIGLAVDGSGNLYVADRLNFRIRSFRPGRPVRSGMAGQRLGQKTRWTWNPTWRWTRPSKFST